ncbi:TPA: Ig-like domain-containing protein [Staphylococcus aureus]
MYWKRFRGRRRNFVTKPASSETAVKSVSIPDSIKTLHVGDTYDLNVVVEPSEQKKLIKYTTDQTKIVSINSDGQVTAEAQGIATVKATAGNKSDSIIINVEG